MLRLFESRRRHLEVNKGIKCWFYSIEQAKHIESNNEAICKVLQKRI